MFRILLLDESGKNKAKIESIIREVSDYILDICSSISEAYTFLKSNHYELMITDYKLNSDSLSEILQHFEENSYDTEIILLCSYKVDCDCHTYLGQGVFEIIEKPFTKNQLLNAMDKGITSHENKRKPSHTDKFHYIIYNSSEMENVVKTARKLSAEDINVLITGESGTGKELVARAIHSESPAKKNKFVAVNCGALPEQLFESELFGHEKGAFTGAEKTKPGLLEMANNGTFFFDEIGDMSHSLQIKLLRMLEEKTIRRIGGTKQIDINVRIIAATNKELEELVAKGTFREDLYYRLNSFAITIPPLRERRSDILILAEHFLNQLNRKNGNMPKTLSENAKKSLLDYNWPGNVREIQNVIGRAYILTSEKVIDTKDLPLSCQNTTGICCKSFLDFEYKMAKDKMLERFETEYLSHHLRINDGNISLTAEKCGIDRRTIHRLINKYNIIYKD